MKLYSQILLIITIIYVAYTIGICAYSQGCIKGMRDTEKRLYGLGELLINSQDNRIKQLESELKKHNIKIPEEQQGQ